MKTGPTDRRPSRRTWIFLGGAIAFIVAGLAAFQGREPPARATMRTVARTAEALEAFLDRHGRPPGAIDDLVADGLLDGPVLDGWGKPVVLRRDPVADRWIEVVSLGADEAPGGRLFASDHVRRVSLDGANGHAADAGQDSPAD